MADILEFEIADAEARFAELLDQVEQGPMVRITCHGKAIARLVPDTEVRRVEAAAALARLKTLREKVRKAPLDEVLASIHEGHKY
jgi:prevent-host-death family protein